MTEPARRESPRGWIAFSIALFLTSVGLAALAITLGSALERERDTHRSIEEVSARFTAALLTFDSANPDEGRQRVEALSTDRFRESYQRIYEGVRKVQEAIQGRAEGAVTRVYVGQIRKDRASAIAVADVTSEAKDAPRQTAAVYIQLDLLRVAGSWRVDSVTDLKTGERSGG